MHIKIGEDDFTWFHYPLLESTMDRAVEMALEGFPHWTIITAGEQTKGRGTKGRTWESPDTKSLLLSIILPPPEETGVLENLPVHAAKALVESIVGLMPLEYEIKHPNDVLVNGKKLAGIIIESVTWREKVSSLVFGMGLNLTQSAEDFTKSGLEATSIFIETGKTVTARMILEVFLGVFKRNYSGLNIKSL